MMSALPWDALEVLWCLSAKWTLSLFPTKSSTVAACNINWALRGFDRAFDGDRRSAQADSHREEAARPPIGDKRLQASSILRTLSEA